jgi:hypothetical protein
LNTSPIPALAALMMLLGISGCMETASNQSVSNAANPSATTQLPGNDPRIEKASLACDNAVIAKAGVSSDDIFSANHREAASGITLDVINHSSSTKWVCNVNTAGKISSLSNGVPL